MGMAPQMCAMVRWSARTAASATTGSAQVSSNDSDNNAARTDPSLRNTMFDFTLERQVLTTAAYAREHSRYLWWRRPRTAK